MKLMKIMMMAAFIGLCVFPMMWPQGNGHAATPLKVGVMGSLTGGSAAYGISQKQGIELAAEEVNGSGGIKGVGPIELLFEDDEGKPDLSATVTQKLINRDKVQAVIGAVHSSCTLADMPFTEKAKIPHVTVVPTSYAITSQGNEWIFRVAFPDSVQVPRLIDFASKQLGYKTFAVLHDADDYGRLGAELIEKAVKERGFTLTFRESFNRKDKDFVPQLLKIKNSGAQVLILYAMYEEGALIAKQAKEQGLKAQLMGGTGVAHERLIALAGPAIEGAIFTLPFLATDPDPRVQAFVKKFEAKFGVKPNNYAAQAYDGTYVLVRAVEKAAGQWGQLKSDVDKRTAIRDALRVTAHEGVLGKIAFDKTGEVSMTLRLAIVKDGNYVPYQGK
jgi:branched-chain amino acid transport system substrate-binding protein